MSFNHNVERIPYPYKKNAITEPTFLSPNPSLACVGYLLCYLHKAVARPMILQPSKRFFSQVLGIVPKHINHQSHSHAIFQFTRLEVALALNTKTVFQREPPVLESMFNGVG